MSIKYTQPGLFSHRLKKNPDEKKFTEKWEKLHRNQNFLCYMISEGCSNDDQLIREHVVAATLIQWLGSPVGQGFLNDCGFYKKEKNEPRN